MIWLSHFWVFVPKNTKTLIQKKICTSVFNAALFTMCSQDTETTKVPINKRIKKIRYIFNMYVIKDTLYMGFPSGASGKESVCQCRRHKELWIQSLGQEDPLEEDMATHSRILAWKIPWPEEPGGLQSVKLQRVEHK